MDEELDTRALDSFTNRRSDEEDDQEQEVQVNRTQFSSPQRKREQGSQTMLMAIGKGTDLLMRMKTQITMSMNLVTRCMVTRKRNQTTKELE